MIFFLQITFFRFPTGAIMSEPICLPQNPILRPKLFFLEGRAILKLNRIINRGYFMAARGYEFYLRVLKVSDRYQEDEAEYR